MDDLPSTLSLDWQRSETPQPTPPFSVSEPLEERPEFDGYLLSPIEATALFRQHRMYPVQLASVFNEESASLFAAWLATSRGTFRPEELPWVPVGNVGPLLILGHVAPEISQPLLPWGTFQPVCLRREDYQRQLTSFANLIEEGLLLDETPSKRWTGGVGRFPATLVMPTERRSAIQFLSQYFLHRSEVWTDWRKTVTPAIAGEQDAALFPEYAAAVRFLTGENSVASITDLRLSEAAQKRLPETLRRRLSVVAERERNLWIGANTLPQADAEDRLYAELGEGWTVHWVLKTNSALPDGSSSSSGVVSGVTGVSKIVRSRRSYPGAQRDTIA